MDFFDLDFFNITIWGYHLSRWPVFNIADASVTVGVVLLLFTHRAAIAEDELPAVKQGGEASAPDRTGRAGTGAANPNRQGRRSENASPVQRRIIKRLISHRRNLEKPIPSLLPA